MFGFVLGVALSLCPDPSLHETKADCPWAALARAAHAKPAQTIAKTAPQLWRDVAIDAKRTSLHAAWGQSRNFDEHEKAPIVDAGILGALGKQLGVPGDGEVVHAGLQHTYGYLFSTLWTAFGYKRARWVDGELERGLKLPAGFLGPTPPSGTLYSNVTCTLASLVFNDANWTRTGCPGKRRSFHRHAHAVESVGPVTLRTDWFPLSTGRALLVYSVTIDSVQRLLTSFPVDANFVDALNAQSVGKDVEIAPRYNAVVPELPAHTRGSRFISTVVEE